MGFSRGNSTARSGCGTSTIISGTGPSPGPARRNRFGRPGGEITGLDQGTRTAGAKALLVWNVLAGAAPRNTANLVGVYKTTDDAALPAQSLIGGRDQTIILQPVADAEQSADPNDYSVGHDDTIRVAGDETLGHYSDWLSVSTQHVREINRFKFRRPVLIGQRIRLDFRKVSREAFEARRREYHRQLQAAYFAAHRIVGTEVYIARPGDSLWTLTQHAAQMPMWLVQQYNPDVDLADLRAGTQIVMPRVEEVGGGG